MFKSHAATINNMVGIITLKKWMCPIVSLMIAMTNIPIPTSINTMPNIILIVLATSFFIRTLLTLHPLTLWIDNICY